MTIATSSFILGQFVHPGLAWGGLGLASLPIIIHILNRRRYRKTDWAAMDFLLAAHKRSVRRLRLEQLLLLFLRCMIILLLGLGLARPFLSAWAAGLGQLRRHHVLLIDNSMSTTVPGTNRPTVFEEIQERATELVDAFSSGDAVTLITLAGPASIQIEHGSYDRQQLRDRIAATQANFGTTDLAGGLRLARQSLERSDIPAANHSVIVLTDNPRAAWLAGSKAEGAQSEASASRLAAEIAAEARLTVLEATPNDRSNMSIERLEAGAHLVGTRLPTPFELQVNNHGDRRVSELKTRILLDGRVARELDVPGLDPHRATTIHFRIQFEEPGDHRLEALLSGSDRDVLEADSRRYLTLSVTDSARVLLVDGKPAARRFDSQCGYLETALAPSASSLAAKQIEPVLITEAELDGEAFGDFGVIILANVRRPSENTWARLRRFVEQGGGLITFLGDNILSEDYNEQGFAQGGGPLPGSIGGRGLTSGETESAYVLFSAEGMSHPIVAEFRTQEASSLFLARTHQYYKLISTTDQAAAPDAARTVLRFSNGDPAIVERLIGDGTSILVATTANMEWTNLPAKGDFVSLAWNLVGYAWPRSAAGRNRALGEPLQMKLTPAQFAGRNEWVLPDGERVPSEILPEGDGFVAVRSSTDQPGIYVHESAGMNTTFACNLDPVESDLTGISETQLRELIGAPFHLHKGRIPARQLAAHPAKKELAWNLLYAAFVLLLVEPLLAMWFGRHR